MPPAPPVTIATLPASSCDCMPRQYGVAPGPAGQRDALACRASSSPGPPRTPQSGPSLREPLTRVETLHRARRTQQYGRPSRQVDERSHHLGDDPVLLWNQDLAEIPDSAEARWELDLDTMGRWKVDGVV